MLSRLLGLGSRAPDDVFFARDILYNELRRWTLVVKGRRYELVRMVEGDYVFFCDYDPDWTVDRERALVDRTRPAGYRARYDCWCMLRIGWSSLSKKEIDWCFADARAHYPPRLSWSQCQDFLRRFTYQFVDRYDIHWRFLMDNTGFEQWSVAQLPPPPTVLLEQAQAAAQQRANFMQRVGHLNAMGASMCRAQQQNIVMNQQIQQNSFGH